MRQAKKGVKPKLSAVPQQLQPSVKSNTRLTKQANDDTDDIEVPYDGSHLLECHGMTQHDTLLNLEGFLQHLEWHTVAPVVR